MENRKARRIVISKNTKIKNLEEEYLGSRNNSSSDTQGY